MMMIFILIVLFVNNKEIQIIQNQFPFHTLVIPIRKRDIKIVLDSGSSHTVINQEAAKFLKSKLIYKEKLIIENMHGEEH